MNKPLLKQTSPLHDDALEERGMKALKEQAYAEAFDVRAKAMTDDIEALPSLKDQVATLTGKLAGMERAMTRPLSVTATTKAPAKPKGTVARPDLIKCLAAGMTAEFMHKVKRRSVDKTLEVLLPGDHHKLSRVVAKAATDPATTTSPGWAAELVQNDVLAFWKAMEPVSVIGALVVRGLVTPFGFNDAGSVSVPKRAEGDRGLTPQWISEAQPIPVLEGSLTSQSLTPHKLAAITVFSNELAKTSVPNIAGLAEQFIKDDLSVALDGKLLSADAAVAGVSPVGLLNGVTPVTPGTGPLDDLKALLSAMVAIRAKRPVFLLDTMTAIALEYFVDHGLFLFRDEMRAGRLMGLPFIVSDNVTGIVALDAASLLMAPGLPETDSSGTASVVMNDQPGQVSDGQEVRSTYQVNGTALRVIQHGISWALLQTGAIATVAAPGWL
ncbi:phage major capsid protein [Ruegeria arenilitoris]|uniref:phage major capsid protein n=1 Tax=Ruegeria arenilitoris TaxID=1173585 RepID=UPI00147B99CC|nr:phage major capsid protein [Ruegeria arenilitoris]